MEKLGSADKLFTVSLFILGGPQIHTLAKLLLFISLLILSSNLWLVYSKRLYTEDSCYEFCFIFSTHCIRLELELR